MILKALEEVRSQLQRHNYRHLKLQLAILHLLLYPWELVESKQPVYGLALTILKAWKKQEDAEEEHWMFYAILQDEHLTQVVTLASRCELVLEEAGN